MVLSNSARLISSPFTLQMTGGNSAGTGFAAGGAAGAFAAAAGAAPGAGGVAAGFDAPGCDDPDAAGF